MHAHAGRDELGHEFGREVRRPIAIDGEIHAHAAVRRLDQRALQVAADLILEQDEGLDDHFALRGGDRGERAREEFLAVLQQLHAIAGTPGSAVRAAFASPGSPRHLRQQRHVVGQVRPRLLRQHVRLDHARVADVDAIDRQQRPARGERARVPALRGEEDFGAGRNCRGSDGRGRANR